MRLKMSRCTKKKAKLVWRSMLNNFLMWYCDIVIKCDNLHRVHPLSVGGLNLPPNFQKSGPDRISILRGRLLVKGSDYFRKGGKGCSFYIKNKLKSETLNDKKKLYTKNFLSAITKDLNWQILTKNLVTFKR